MRDRNNRSEHRKLGAWGEGWRGCDFSVDLEFCGLAGRRCVKHAGQGQLLEAVYGFSSLMVGTLPEASALNVGSDRETIRHQVTIGRCTFEKVLVVSTQDSQAMGSPCSFCYIL